MNKISTITQYFFIFQKNLVLLAREHLKSPIQYGFPRIIWSYTYGQIVTNILQAEIVETTFVVSRFSVIQKETISFLVVYKRNNHKICCLLSYLPRNNKRETTITRHYFGHLKVVSTFTDCQRSTWYYSLCSHIIITFIRLVLLLKWTVGKSKGDYSMKY